MDQIELCYTQYQEASMQMYVDHNYLSALKAAVLAPTLFLKDINNFEVTFDAIIHHLEVSISKANVETEISHVQRVAQELFQVHVFLIEQKINYQKSLNSRNALEKAKSFFTGNNIQEPEYIFPAAMLVGATGLFEGGVSIVLGIYLEKLYKDWKINIKSAAFYVQLARTYRKIIASRIYNKQFGLLDNIIDRNKIDIVQGIITSKDWDEGIEFIAYLDYRKPFTFSNLKNSFYRGYRKSFAKRNIISTYFFYCLILTTVIFAAIWLAFRDWGSGEKTVFFLVMFFFAVFFARFEHRLIPLKYRLWQRSKSIQG